MLRTLVFGVLFLATPALAGKIAIVDFQRAVAETDEGKKAEQRLEQGMTTRRAELSRQQTELERLYKDYEARKLILNEEARKSAEMEIVNKQRKLEADAQRFEQEMQQEYLEIVSSLDGSMRELSGRIAKEKGYDIVLDQSAVIYASGETVDMTPELIRRYNARGTR
jgi:outer membrane protein